MLIDIKFDFSSEVNEGQDIDKHSKTLKKYHELLWTKPLPSGNLFTLENAKSKGYLIFRSGIKDFYLTSDSIANSLKGHKGCSEVIEQVNPLLINSFLKLNCTIGAYILFPGQRVNGAQTINVARGWNRYIKDRFDLTLECIRRHYLGEESPLSKVFSRYADFFDLFGEFGQYVDFFLLNDLVSEDYSEIRYFISQGKNLNEEPRPSDLTTYLSYRENSMRFVSERNKRIEFWSTQTAS